MCGKLPCGKPTDLQTAVERLAGHTICLCKDGECLYSDRRGIVPMINFISDEVRLNGYSVADTVVGKAAAMLFVKCGIVAVYAKTLSKSGKAVLEKYGIPFGYGALTERIINREGTDMCPMEKAVADCDDIEKAYLILKEKLNRTL